MKKILKFLERYPTYLYNLKAFAHKKIHNSSSNSFCHPSIMYNNCILIIIIIMYPLFSSVNIATEKTEGSWSTVTRRNKRYSNSYDYDNFYREEGVQFYLPSVLRHFHAHAQFFAGWCAGAVAFFLASSTNRKYSSNIIYRQ